MKEQKDERTAALGSALGGYVFRSPELLIQALTHRSFSKHNNERLEFLGDACLGFIVTDFLYQQFPGRSEGELTRLRSNLVNRRMMAKLARRCGLAKHLILGDSERANKAWQQRSSILTNAMEAVLGALYLDGGIKACRTTLLLLLQDEMAVFCSNSAADAVSKDAKTQLQEYLQAKQYRLPGYRVLEEHGPGHAKTFKVECVVEELSLSTHAVEYTKKRAEHNAAERMLQRLNQINGVADT